MNEQENTELVRQAYAAYGRGDLEQVLACLSPQVEWEIQEVPPWLSPASATAPYRWRNASG